jgi:hypothetical protein
MDTVPPFRFVTASLRVDFTEPTRRWADSSSGAGEGDQGAQRSSSRPRCYAGDVATARGEIVTVRMPETFLEKP